MPRVLAPLVLLLLWLMKIAASPHSLRIGECEACSAPRLSIVLLVRAVDVLRKTLPGLPALAMCSPIGSVLRLVKWFAASVRICVAFYGLMGISFCIDLN